MAHAGAALERGTHMDLDWYRLPGTLSARCESGVARKDWYHWSPCGCRFVRRCNIGFGAGCGDTAAIPAQMAVARTVWIDPHLYGDHHYEAAGVLAASVRPDP